MTDTTAPEISRRNLFGGIALSMLLPQSLSADQVKTRLDALDAPTLYTLVRGLTVLDALGDPVLTDDATALLAEVEMRLPGATLLRDIHRLYPIGGPLPHPRPESAATLAALHTAIAGAQSVAFTYTDLEGDRTTRRVLRLVLVHPPHGVQLLALCELRGDFRKFFVRSMTGLAADGPVFIDRRTALLADLLVHERGRAPTGQGAMRSTVNDPFV